MGWFKGLTDAIGAVGGVVGSILDYNQGRKNTQVQVDQAALDRSAQYDFAKHGLTWKVQDAISAGLHPLAALGASSSGYSPSAAVFESPSSGNIARSIGNMGQALGRAAMAKQDTGARELINAQIEELKARTDEASANALLARKRADQTALPPPMPNSDPMWLSYVNPDGTLSSGLNPNYSQTIGNAMSLAKYMTSPDARFVAKEMGDTIGNAWMRIRHPLNTIRLAYRHRTRR